MLFAKCRMKFSCIQKTSINNNYQYQEHISEIVRVRLNQYHILHIINISMYHKEFEQLNNVRIVILSKNN